MLSSVEQNDLSKNYMYWMLVRETKICSIMNGIKNLSDLPAIDSILILNTERYSTSLRSTYLVAHGIIKNFNVIVCSFAYSPTILYIYYSNTPS